MIGHKNILELDYSDAQKVLLKSSSYCSIDLPFYFDFSKILSDTNKKIKSVINGDDFSKLLKNSGKQPSDYDKVNYKIYANKSEKFDYRQLEIMNPIIYVFLVKLITDKDNWKIITDRFADIRKKCAHFYVASIPTVNDDENIEKKEQILDYWSKFEQETLRNAIRYSFICSTDISNCYGSIYTHSISWALHEKSTAKNIRKSRIN